MLNDRASSFQSPTAHLVATAMAGGVLIVAVTSAGVVSVVFTWGQEVASSGRMVINATAAGIIDVIEAVSTTVESVVRAVGSCTNRIAGRVGYEFEMTVAQTRFCVVTFMLFIFSILVVQFAIVVVEDG